MKIVVHMTGSIAAFKTCELISKLVKEGNDLQIVATKDLFEFIGSATLEGLTGKPVLSDIYERGHQMDHIHLARNADLHLLCPATANTINKLAAGLADNFVTSILIANNFQKPVIIVPAMNSEMFDYPATKESLKKLQIWGARIVEGEPGDLACGEWGKGRMAEVNEISESIQEVRA